METRTASPGASPPAPDLPLPARVWAVYTAPRELFLSLRERPRILGAFVLLLVLGGLSAVLLSGVAVESQLRILQSKPDMTPEQIAAAQKVTKGLGIPAFVFGSVLISFVWSAVLLLFANVFLGGRTSYRQLLSAVMHIGLVGLPALLVKAPLALAKHDINIQTSLAAFLPSAQQKTFLYQFLAQTDLFSLWMWGLSILAVSTLAGLPPRRVAVLLGATWLVVSLLAAGAGTLG